MVIDYDEVCRRFELENRAITDVKQTLGGWHANDEFDKHLTLGKQKNACSVYLGEYSDYQYGNWHVFSTTLDDILYKCSIPCKSDFKTIKFTKENAQKHLKFSNKYILTGRDSIKGEVGEYVSLENIQGIWKIVHIYEPLSIVDYAKQFWLEEGFENAFELWSELKRIYGDDAKIYGHRLENTLPDTWLTYL